jgi:hypothetical protein
VRVIGLLSFYDEPAPAIAACLTTLRERLGMEHLVALDGAYAQFRGGRPASPPERQASVALACRELGMTCDVVVPERLWAGEVEKRTALFGLGYLRAEPGDWFVVQDADVVVLEAPTDLRERLAATDRPAANVRVRDAAAPDDHPAWPKHYDTLRPLFRAQRIRLETNHFTYLGERGEVLWAGGDDDLEVPGLDLAEDVLFEHRPNVRDRDRQAAKHEYYVDRDESGIELGRCRCGARATHKLAARWRRTRDGAVVAERLVEACDRCSRRIERQSARELRAIDVDPRGMTISQRHGRPPE